MLSFLRVEPNGSSTLLTSEYTDTKALPSRFYTQDFRASTFSTQFSFSSTPEEHFYGAGQQACCNDNSVNKKGQVVDLINYNSHVTLPVYMSNKVIIDRPNHNSLTQSSAGIPSIFQHAGSRENRYIYICHFLSSFLSSDHRPVEFSPLRTRFEASEASVVDYYMYVNIILAGNATFITSTQNNSNAWGLRCFTATVYRCHRWFDQFASITPQR